MTDGWREIPARDGERRIGAAKWKIVAGGPDHADYACDGGEVRKQVRPALRYFFRPLPTNVCGETISADGMTPSQA